ncbi:MAG: hypothetical protein MUE97_02610 [Phycisphaerales bacterium]|nr:hypothetical protein [Phycisphaerales bacterium]
MNPTTPSGNPSQSVDFAHRWFIDAMSIHDQWWLLIIPMALLIAVAYKAVRLKNLDRYWREVGLMTVQILLGMAALAGALWLLAEVYVKQWMNG